MPVTKRFDPQTPADNFTCFKGGRDLAEEIQAGSFQVTAGSADLKSNGQVWLWHIDRACWQLMWPVDANEQLGSGEVRLAKPRT